MKKILCMLLACVLCVSTRGGCMAIPITSEKNVDGYVDLNVYPEIKEQKDRIIESILQECESKGEPLKDTNEYIGKPDIGSYIFVDFSNKERSCNTPYHPIGPIINRPILWK